LARRAHWSNAFGKLTNQRIELARTSNNHPAVNAKITGRAEYEHDFYQSLELEGLTEKYAPFEHCLVYQLQIDVDGYGPAWSGLFNKLYTGRPVVKVLSLHGFRQWYYFSLIDKYNLYYVKPDMSDLASTVDLLLSNDQDNLNVIGQRARDIVKSLQYARVVRSKQAEICDWIEGKQSMAN
jgi:hypothetical protein